MTRRPLEPRVLSGIRADEPCLPSHATPEARRFRRALFRAHPSAFLLLGALLGVLLAFLFRPLR